MPAHRLELSQEPGIPAGHTYKKTGASVARPGLTPLLAYAQPGDVIVVHTLGGPGRNLREVLNPVHVGERRTE